MKSAGLLITIMLLFSCTLQSPKKSSVLLITGGHRFDTLKFFQVFENFSEFEIDTISQPRANDLIGTGEAERYDILVFYDSWQKITENEKEAYLNLTKQGKGFLFLHHSLVSYQGWKEFSDLRGGIYPKSNPPDTINDGKYRHDIDLLLTIKDPDHIITTGMNDFMIHDEGYSNIRIGENVSPLLLTEHADCAPVCAWTNKYNNSKVVYFMGGHDKQAYGNENFEKFIRNSLNYLSGRQD